MLAPLMLALYVALRAQQAVPKATAAAVPSFAEFGVAREHVAETAAVRLDDAKNRRYATRLKAFARRSPDFAGHFVVASWGCGASCVMAAAIDARTGEVRWVPFTVCCWLPSIKEPLEFRVDSQLLVVHGSRNETGNGTYFYRFDGRGFRLVQAYEGAP